MGGGRGVRNNSGVSQSCSSCLVTCSSALQTLEIWNKMPACLPPTSSWQGLGKRDRAEFGEPATRDAGFPELTELPVDPLFPTSFCCPCIILPLNHLDSTCSSAGLSSSDGALQFWHRRGLPWRRGWCHWHKKHRTYKYNRNWAINKSCFSSPTLCWGGWRQRQQFHSWCFCQQVSEMNFLVRKYPKPVKLLNAVSFRTSFIRATFIFPAPHWVWG